MSRLSRAIRFVLIGSFVVGCGIAGCTKKPSQEEVSKLEEARVAAESAEKKLAELRQERMKLEQELQSKQTELNSSEAERNQLKAQVGK